MAFKMNGFSGFQKKSAAYKKVNPEETFTPMANQDPADIEKNERKLRPENEFSTFRNNKLPTTDVVGTNSDEVKYTTKTKENNKRKVTKYFDPETGKKLGKKVNTRNKNTKVKATTNTIKKEEVDKDYFKGKTKEENTKKKLRQEKRALNKSKRQENRAKRKKTNQGKKNMQQMNLDQSNY